MREVAQRKTSGPEEATGCAMAETEASVPLAVLLDNQLVKIGDQAVPERRDGVCSCGACDRGRHADSAADYFPEFNARADA